MKDVSTICSLEKREGFATLRRRPLVMLLLAVCAVTVSGCGFWPVVTYRYKLTLTVDTPEGVKTAFSVVQLDYYRSLDGNLPRRAYGQSLVLDLGERGALIALVIQVRFGKWSQIDPSGLLWKKCGGQQQPVDYSEVINRINSCRTPFSLDAIEQPDLIYFKDAKNSKSGMLIDPSNTMLTLGPEIKIKSVTLQVTDEALTHGIDDHLPWAREREWHLSIPVGDGVQRLESFIARTKVIQGE